MNLKLVLGISLFLVSLTVCVHADTFLVGTTTYTGTGTSSTGVIDFLHSTPDSTFGAGSGLQFLGFVNNHVKPNGDSADAYYDRTLGILSNDIGVILSGGAASPLSSYIVTAAPIFDSGSNYGFNAPHTNGAIYNFGTYSSLAFVSKISGGATSGNVSYFVESVSAPAAAAPEPSQLILLTLFLLSLVGAIQLRRQRVF